MGQRVGHGGAQQAVRDQLVGQRGGAGAVGGHLGQGLCVKAEGCQAPDDTGAALGIDDNDVAGALIHGGGAHAGQAGQIVLQLVRLGQRHARLTEMQADAPAAPFRDRIAKG